MSYYVCRSERSSSRSGWTGPIRSEHQAHREAEAWESAGWAASVVASSPAVKQAVRSWQKAKVSS